MTPHPSDQRSEPASDAALEVMLQSAFPGTPSADSYARRLRTLDAARESTLTFAEYAELREDLLAEISETSRKPFGGLRVLVALSAVSLVVACIGVYSDIRELYLGGGFLVVVLLGTCAWMGYCRHRTTRLSIADRLAIVEHLESEKLLQQTEVLHVRARLIEQRGNTGTA